jgi:hypothetical protein
LVGRLDARYDLQCKNAFSSFNDLLDPLPGSGQQYRRANAAPIPKSSGRGTRQSTIA